MIEVKNITKVYDRPVLKGINLTIEKGEILGLLGVNGSGKTTLSSIIATLHPPTSGDILFQGRSAYQQLSHYRKCVGYCPQKPNLHPLLTVEQNLYNDGLYYGYSPQESRARMESLIEQFELGTYRASHHMTLSGGYQQRVMIARALMHDPELVILDEPTVGLDPAIRKKLWSIIKNLGKTIILTTHYLDEADVLSDRVCILEAGQVMLIDTPQNLRSQHGQKSLEDIFVKLTEEEASC